jgi:hypothetical protein
MAIGLRNEMEETNMRLGLPFVALALGIGLGGCVVVPEYHDAYRDHGYHAHDA